MLFDDGVCMSETSRDEFFDGSDENRISGDLPHAQYATFDQPLALEGGGELPSVTVAYETYGRLNEDKSNAVLVCHALTGDSHVARHGADDTPGWWDIVVGPGRPIDTDRFFVICPNVLGGCRGTTGPISTNPATGRPYGQDFPNITIGDMVNAQRRLVEHLGIERLLAVVGGSMGGHQCLQWAHAHGQAVAGIAAIATSPRLTSQSLAFDVVGRNAIRQDPHFNDGQYYDQTHGPDTGLAIARMLGHITYLSPIAMSQKFEATRNQPRDVDTDFEKEFSVGSYLAYKGDQFVERFDANSYIALSMAMDQFDLGEGVETLTEALGRTASRWLVISFSGDWLFPPFQSKQITHALVQSDRPVSFCNIESSCGHDAFLLEDDFDSYGEMLRGFLANVAGDGTSSLPENVDEPYTHSPTYIFHRQERLDYQSIMELIPAGASVLDAGCGTGGLLTLLKQRGHERIMGVELDEPNIRTCIRRGLDVVQRDLNRGLKWFRDGQFDCVVLSHTIQAVYDVEALMDELVRVGKRCIISVPNLGYHKLVDQLVETGRTPQAETLPFKWYDTPNIRVLTLNDFQDFCDEKGIEIHMMVALDTEAGREIPHDENPNRNADLAIYVVSRS
jgi:homoserine O-acetyltransferase